MPAHCIMVLGTTSGAGKSWLTTALCRHYARQGLKVAPFKAQNMSNNARVVGAGGFAAGPPQGETRPPRGAGSHTQWASVGAEIGSAQYFQALAARAVPDVRMNPLLLKPESDTHSQVVLLGQVSTALTALPWRERSEHVWPAITAALDALRAENDVVVIEGAGSPAEINLSDCDIVNMRVALHSNAACLLAAASQLGHNGAAVLLERAGSVDQPIDAGCPEDPSMGRIYLEFDLDRYVSGLRLPRQQVVAMIRRLAPLYGVNPQLAVAMAAVESNFDPAALSPKSAMGVMQLIPATAERFGVRNPYDPEQNIRGGLAYLRWLHGYFGGDVERMVAAYNAGEGAVMKHGGVPPYAETLAYVSRVLYFSGFEKKAQAGRPTR